MKKLMFTAGAVAIAAGAFATAPTVYDYKASVKHMYLKEVTVSDTSLATPQKVHVYQKIQKTSSLKGYLVQDTQACLGGKVAAQTAADTRAWDQRRNRAFLVVLNSSATPAAIRQPKIMPAVLEAKYMDKSFNGKTYLTEGTLYVGGDLVILPGVTTPATNLRPYLMPGSVPAGAYAGTTLAAAWSQSIENATTPRPRQNAKGYFGDYLWTSAYLFGQFNGPQWSTANWGVAENKVINGMPQFMKPRNTALNVTPEVNINPATGVNGYYHDTWMNHAGFGTGIAGSTATAVCCGLSTVTSVPVTLQSLSGNMKGGLFICSENGFYTGAENVAPYGVYRGGDLWEDQFWSASINRAKSTATAGDVYPLATYFGATAVNTGDNYQMDIWTDGDVETFTTDVMSGTWSIKLNTRLAGVALTKAEVDGTFLNGAAAATPTLNTTVATQAGFVPTAANSLTNAQQDIWDFNEMLKGAATALSSTVIFANGTEISSKQGNNNRFNDLPMITPKFAVAYGLDGQHLWVATPVLANPAAANSIYR